MFLQGTEMHEGLQLSAYKKRMKGVCILVDGLAVHGVMEVISTMDAAAQGWGYRLYVIKEEAVPLVGNIIRSRFFPVTIVVMMVMLLGALAGLYIVACRQYRIRIAELTGHKQKLFAGWRLWRLKEMTHEIEYELTGENV